MYADREIQDAYARPDAEPPVSGRRYIEPEMHIHDTGVSAPLCQGRGRRFIAEEDHQVTRQDHDDAVGLARGRRAFPTPPQQVFGGAEQQLDRPCSPQEMKGMIRELIQNSGLIVFDEKRWEDVCVEKNGSHWKVHALTETKRSIGREGCSGRAIADKLTMAPVAELRHFGVRFGAAVASEGAAYVRCRGSVLEENPSFASQGVRTAMGGGPRRSDSPEVSSSRRKAQQDMSRRYISSGLENGQDHWMQAQTQPPGELAKEGAQGKRFLGTSGNLANSGIAGFSANEAASKTQH